MCLFIYLYIHLSIYDFLFTFVFININLVELTPSSNRASHHYRTVAPIFSLRKYDTNNYTIIEYPYMQAS